jgi:hypothetical protein
LQNNENSPATAPKNLIAVTGGSGSSSKKTPTTATATPPSHLIQLTSPKNQLNQMLLFNQRNEVNSLPLCKERPFLTASTSVQQIANSQSYDGNLSKAGQITTTTMKNTSPSVAEASGRCATPGNAINPAVVNTINNNNNNNNNTPVNTNIKSTLHNFNKTNLNSPKSRSSATPNLQKYYSFQKPSFNINENKCNCFNMPFVCEVCTTRFDLLLFCFFVNKLYKAIAEPKFFYQILL